MNILEVQNISKTYKKAAFALDNVSFNIHQGSIMGLVGENGSGKTTTLGIITGLLRPETGQVNVFGKPYHIDDVEMKGKIGVVFDTNYFPEGFTPRNIAKIWGKIYKNWDNLYFNQLLEKYGIKANAKIRTLSHGTKAMVGIITALAQRPQLLVLDEPTNGVDPNRREETLDLFMDFISNGENAILFSSHITSDLEKIADYITIIHQGKVLAVEEKDTLLYQYGIVRAGEGDFQVLKPYAMAYTKRDYQYRLLVNNQGKVPPGNYVVENPTIEEVMYLLTRGERP